LGTSALLPPSARLKCAGSTPRPPEVLEIVFIGGPYAGIYLVVDGMPLPRVGSEYLLFLTRGDGWASPAYVQFSIQNGRLGAHTHNEQSVGRDLVGLPLAAVEAQARAYTFDNGRKAGGEVAAE